MSETAHVTSGAAGGNLFACSSQSPGERKQHWSKTHPAQHVSYMRRYYALNRERISQQRKARRLAKQAAADQTAPTQEERLS